MKHIDFNHQVQSAIAGNVLLTLLSDPQRQQLAAHATLWLYEKGEVLWREGEKADYAFAVLSGQFKVFKRGRQRLLIDIIVSGEIGGAICYPLNALFEFSASAIEAGKVLKFRAAELRNYADSNASFSRALLEDVCLRLRHAQHMRSLSRENVAGRVACALLYLQQKFGDEIPHTRATLAELAGTTVESAIRATKALSHEGLLMTGRGRMQVTSVSGLKKFAHKTDG